MAKYAYQQMLEEHKIEIDKLPETTRQGISEMNQIDGAIRLSEKNGSKISNQTHAKIKRLDSWIVRDITDYLQDKDTNTADVPVTAAAVVKAIAADGAASTVEPPVPEPLVKSEPVVELPKADPRAESIDAEFKALIAAGKTALTLAELKSGAPSAYKIIFDTYEAEGENGVETSHYSCTEAEKGKQVFNLKKI